MNNPTRKRLTIPALAVASLLLAIPAVATTTDPDQTTIPGDAAGTITITKYQNTSGVPCGTGLPNNGTQLDSSQVATLTTNGCVPAAGVTYQICQVPGVDLSTASGWTAAASNSVTTAQAAITAATSPAANCYTGTTDANGQISGVLSNLWTQTSPSADAGTAVSQLPQGQYLIDETAVPPGSGLIPGPAFLTTVPLTDPTNQTEWMYSQYLYPKNNTLTPLVKTINTTSAYTTNNPAAPITYTLYGAIPFDADGASVTQWDLTDQTDPAVTPTGVAPTVQLVPTATAPAGTNCTPSSQLVAGADYTASAQNTAGGIVEVSMTPDGLAKLSAIQYAAGGAGATEADVANCQVVVSFTANQNADGTDVPNGGSLTNPTTLTTATGDDPATTENSNVVTSSYGAIQIIKNGATLNGASFMLFKADADGGCTAATDFAATNYANVQVGGSAATSPYQAGTADATALAALGTEAPVPFSSTTDGTGAPVYQVTTGANDSEGNAVPAGTANMSGLLFADSTGVPNGNYCVLETQAPAGYQLMVAPIPVTVSNSLATVNAVNPPASQLPLSGTVAQVSLGVVVLFGGAAAVYFINRTKAKAA